MTIEFRPVHPNDDTHSAPAGNAVIFIENDIDGYAQLADALAPGTDIVILDAGDDGLARIAEALAGRRDVSAVHIVSHGADGIVKLGTAALNNDNLAEHSTALQAIRASLAPGADILLYGCNIGRGDAGAALLDGLAHVTGADLAASTDATGPAALGGNWELERESGQVEAAVIFSGAAAQRFQGLLAAPADENFDARLADSGYDGPAGPNAVAAAGPRTLGGLVYTGGGGSGGFFTAWIQPVGAAHIGSGQHVGINQEGAPLSYIEVHSSSLADNFKLISLLFETFSAADLGTDTYTIEGYDNGVQVTSDSLNVLVSDSTGSVHYANVGGAAAGTLTFDASWQNVDTIRFTTTGGTPIVFLDGIDIDTAVVPPPGITNAAYDATTAVLTVTGTNLATGAAVDVSKLTLTGEGGGAYTLTTANVTASSATTFTVTLNAADKTYVNGLLNKNGPTAFSGTTFNLGAAAGWVGGAAADASGNGVTVSNTAAPQVTSATYDASSNVLTVTGSNLVRTLGPNNDVTVSKLTLTGEGNSTRPLSASNVDITSATSFSVTLSGADLFIVEQMFNKNGATSTGGSAYNLAAGEDWNSTVHGVTASATSTVTVANVPDPTITRASYVADTGTLVVIGTGLVHAGGAANDIAASRFTITGEGGAAYTLTDTPSVEIGSGTTFTLTLSSTDRAALVSLLNQNGTASTGGTAYSLAAASNWAAGAGVGAADLTGNVVTVTNLTRPTVSSIILNDSALKAGETATVTVVFSEAVSGFTAADIAAVNATAGAPSSSNGGVTWSFSLTPAGGVTDAANVVTVQASGVVNAAGYAGTSSTSSANYTIDTARPTATVTVADAVLAAGETSLVTFAFSEAVTGFANADLALANGTLSAVSTLDGGVTWTATLTPAAGVTAPSNLIALDLSGVQDMAGNAGSGTANSNSYAVSTVRPGAAVVVADTALKAGETALVTITFSEAVSGFTNSDLVAANGALTAVASLDGGMTWTATLTPGAGLTDTSNVITLDNTGVVNAAGNTGSGTTASNNYAIDTVLPTAAITLADTALKAGETSLVTVVFSEAVTGFTASDLALANGTLGALASLDGGITWSATFTPDPGVTAGTNTITLDNTGVFDAAGNPGAGSTNSPNYAIDTERPSATVTVADSVLTAGETSLVTIAFSEAVTGFANADLAVANGTLGAVSTLDGGLTWTATLTPAANIAAASNLITLDTTGVLDAAGNTGAGATNSNNYAVATARPTASVVVADAALKAGESSLVTITFSEAVSGFTNADLTLANGTLTAVSTLDGGMTWTASFTPGPNLTAATNAITLDNTGVANGAGNAGSGTTASNNYAIDTARPTAGITVASAALKAGETSLVTIVFSEAVASLGASDLAAANGTLGALASLDGGVTWTTTFTPAAGVTQSANLITLDNTGVLDAAGNAGAGTTGSNNYAIDTARPTATVTMADSALSSGETSLVTIAFSEAVTGVTNADLLAPNGTLGTVSTTDGGLTWTAAFTPAANVTDTTNIITLAASGAVDAAGNHGAGVVGSNNYAVQTAPPTASVMLADAALKAGATSLVTLTFSEAVSGVTNDLLSVPNGTLGALATLDGGVTWSASFTPDAGITDTSNVITLDLTGVTSGPGNQGIGSAASDNFAIDTAPPTAAIVVAARALAIGQSSVVTISFSEAVAGFTSADLTVANGTLGALASTDGGVTWTATLTPAPDVVDGANLVTLDSSGVVDAAGNAGVGTTGSNSYAIDTARPRATIVFDNPLLRAGGSTRVWITFSEAVTGFANAGLTATNGTLGAVSSLDGGITWSATFTPAAGLLDLTNVLTLDNTGVRDAAGNAGAGATDSANYEVRTLRPTAGITVAGSALRSGETALVTIAFSEAVTGLARADLSVANGTLGALSSADGGLTWTAMLTPAAGVTAGASAITLDNARVTSALGNTGTGTTTSNAFAIDTAPPGATVTVDSAALEPGASATVTIRFSEAVTGFGLEDIVAGSASLGNLASTDGGLTWTALLTAAAGAQADANTVRVKTSGVTDAAGNAGTVEAISNSYAVGSRPVPTNGGVAGTTIDGVAATTTRSTDPKTGQVIDTVAVPVVSGARMDDPSSPNRALADIPLGIRDASGALLAELTVSLPAGIGMLAQGPAALLPASEALRDLVRRIEARTEAGSPVQAEMTGQGGSFLGSLDAHARLETRTLVLTAAGAAPAQPIQITGSPNHGAGLALVIDASGLPAGTVLHLNDVDFAAVVGAVTLGAGAGRNVVVGDGAAQNIHLGAADDDLHGGGGNDIVAGGSGNDKVRGGSGNDTVIGGRSDTGQWQFFIDDSGQVSARHESPEFGPGGWENVGRAELDAGAGGLGFLDAPAARLQELALLYQAALGRAPDLPGLEFWAAQGGSARATMAMFMQQSEYASGSYAQLGDEAFVRAVFSSVLGRAADAPGVSYWTGLLASAQLSRSDMLAGFALGDEFKAHVAGAAGLSLGRGTVTQQAQWFGGSGDDLLDGGPGSDLLVGGDGTDTVVYNGARSQYHFVVGKDGSIRIADSANGDVDVVKGIERGQFGDGVVELGFTQAPAAALQTVGLLYQTLFDRAGDLAGFTWWLGLHSDALQLARAMAGTEEFKARYAGLDDAGFVKALFDNTGLQAGQAGGMGYWQDYLRGHTRAETAAAWTGNADVIGVQFSGDGLWIV